MRFPDDAGLTALRRGLVTIFLAASLAGCGTSLGGTSSATLPSTNTGPSANGPQADYPVLIGDPYTIADVEHVPSDTMNYDEVGYLAVDDGATGYTGSHHTLPLPSYVEVTSLESGRTILVRLERRGPMASNHLLALAPTALAQLEATAESPVRVRRVNPPEQHRALLRAGDAAPLRMDTPTSLLTVLQRRLPQNGATAVLTSSSDATRSSGIETIGLAASGYAQQPAVDSVDVELPRTASERPAVANSSAPPALPPIEAVAEPRPDATETMPTREEPQGTYVVQAAAFSTMDRAQRVADVIGGVVTQAGQYYRVRTGPFATRGEAEASLANVRRAGYSDARILTNG